MPVIWLLIACRAVDPTDSDPVDTDPSDTDVVDTDPGEPGLVCDPAEQIGRVEIFDEGGTAYLGGRIFDAVDPWIGAPELTNDACAFHRFEADSCGDCPTDEVCSVSGECVPQRRAIKDVEVVVTSGSASQTFQADPTTGELYGALDIGGPGATYTLVITWGSRQVTFGPLGLAGGLEATITSEGDSMQPGALDVSWAAPSDGGYVTTRIPINHHAGGPTFTTCMAPAEDGGFVVDAGMTDPLAVITGLEFQGLEHVQAASVDTADGCVDVRLGTRVYSFVTYP